jgi:hypothetical protein
MKNLLRTFLLGAIVGVILGVAFAERGHTRRQKEKTDAYANDPEMRRLREETRRVLQSDLWLDEVEEGAES